MIIDLVGSEFKKPQFDTVAERWQDNYSNVFLLSHLEFSDPAERFLAAEFTDCYTTNENCYTITVNCDDWYWDSNDMMCWTTNES